MCLMEKSSLFIECYSRSQEVPCIYETWRFITMFIKVHFCTLYWVSSILFVYSKPGSVTAILTLSFHLCLGFPSAFFPWDFPIKISHAFLVPTMCVTCPTLHSSILPFAGSKYSRTLKTLNPHISLDTQNLNLNNMNTHLYTIYWLWIWVSLNLQTSLDILTYSLGMVNSLNSKPLCHKLQFNAEIKAMASTSLIAGIHKTSVKWQCNIQDLGR